MNILIAMPWDEATGGVGQVVASLAHSLTARGHGVTFLFPDERWVIRRSTSRHGFEAFGPRLRSYPGDGAGVRARLSWYSTVLTTLPQLVRIARARRVDLINVHYPGSGLALIEDLRRSLDVPLVVSCHGSDLLTDSGPNRRPGLLRLLAGAAAIVTPSRVFLESILAFYGEIEPKALHIYNGFDESELHLAGRRQEDESMTRLTLVCVAAHTHKKGLDVLLRALHLLGHELDLTLRLIGDGPLRAPLEGLSAELGLENRVVFLGAKGRRDVFEELARCDALVMPSRHSSESFGLASLEAMACGKPVIASAVGGLVELVGDRDNGLLVPREDPQALAEAIRLLAKNPELRSRLGAAGRLKSQRFTLKRMTDEYEGLFARLMRAGQEGRPASKEALNMAEIGLARGRPHEG